MNKIFAILIVLLVFGGGCQREDTSGKPLRVVVDVVAPSSFLLGGNKYGYGYELMDKYAETLNRKLSLSDNYNFSAAMRALGSGSADAVITLQKSVDEVEYRLLPLFETNYVALTRARNAKKYRTLSYEGLTDRVVGSAAVMLSAGFDRTADYSALMDSLPNAHIYSSAKDTYSLAQEVISGNYDLLVCERSQAVMLLTRTKGLLVQVYEFPEKIDVNIVYRSTEKGMAGFEKWLDAYRMAPEFRILTATYMGKDMERLLQSVSVPNQVWGGISIWDDVFQSVGKRWGVDWLLLSAIAYQESRFKNNLVSPKGAMGIMQIMPIVAQNFKVDEAQLFVPSVNIMLAARLIKSIYKELDLPAGTTEEDRLAIMLAAYNWGIGNIDKVRDRAVEDGFDANAWTTLEGYVVAQAVEYVQDVMETYDRYKVAVNS